jgi:RNA polymerase sigma-70 factor, ECF subfamily
MREKVEKADETFLVLRCQSGDREAFDLLLETIQASLWRYISNLSGAPDLADDILQDVFLIIYRKIGWLNDPDLFRPWAYRIATRETFRILKKRSKWREDPLDEVGAAASFAGHEVSPTLDAKLLAKVSPASRAVLMLHYLEDLSLNETAEALDLSVGTVKSRLAYGLKVLRGEFDREGAR